MNFEYLIYFLFVGLSGSGKTSLLNALSFSTKSPLTVYGRIMLNGCDVDATRMAMISRYIQQDDLFFGTLTVKEHLTFHVSHLINNFGSG